MWADCTRLEFRHRENAFIFKWYNMHIPKLLGPGILTHVDKEYGTKLYASILEKKKDFVIPHYKSMCIVSAQFPSI